MVVGILSGDGDGYEYGPRDVQQGERGAAAASVPGGGKEIVYRCSAHRVIHHIVYRCSPRNRYDPSSLEFSCIL